MPLKNVPCSEKWDILTLHLIVFNTFQIRPQKRYRYHPHVGSCGRGFISSRPLLLAVPGTTPPDRSLRRRNPGLHLRVPRRAQREVLQIIPHGSPRGFLCLGLHGGTDCGVLREGLEVSSAGDVSSVGVGGGAALAAARVSKMADYGGTQAGGHRCAYAYR